MMPPIRRRGAIDAWTIDDTSFANKGRHPVGEHHRDELLGKQASQVTVTLSIANHHAGLPIA